MEVRRELRRWVPEYAGPARPQLKAVDLPRRTGLNHGNLRGGDIRAASPRSWPSLKRVDFDPARDRLCGWWATSSAIGAGFAADLRFVRDLGPAAVTVLGNHDLYLLMVAYGTVRSQGRTTPSRRCSTPRTATPCSAGCAPAADAPRNGHAMVHAGPAARLDRAQARALAREVEGALAGPPADLLTTCGAARPAAWHDDLRDYARMRVIVNAMMPACVSAPRRAMDFKVKGEVTKAPKGYVPWFEVPGGRAPTPRWCSATGRPSGCGSSPGCWRWIRAACGGAAERGAAGGPGGVPGGLPGAPATARSNPLGRSGCRPAF